MNEKEAKRKTKMIEKTSIWIREEFLKCIIALETETNNKKINELNKKLEYLKLKASAEVKQINQLCKELGIDDESGLDFPET